MMRSALNAISPIDGRYSDKTQELIPYFSEFALIKYRVKVELEYFVDLVNFNLKPLKDFPREKFSDLRDLYLNFSLNDAEWIKNSEKVTNHDVKAVEYFVKQKFDELGLTSYAEFVHFGLTSQDINNTAIPLSIKDFVHTEYLPQLDLVIKKLEELQEQWAEVSMLAHTHGQPASPTSLGKEIKVFSERLSVQRQQLINIPFSAKFGGATGNFNAHNVAFPNHDWVDFANRFVNETLGLNRSQTTTQIEHYDNLAALMDACKRINTILIDLNRDMWSYISMDYFKQKLKDGEVGSSAMPHKVNPIDFENAEGNLGIANALFEHLAAKLPISRLQRDLTDSTVLRVLGVPFGHTFIALKSAQKGLSKLVLNDIKIQEDLENNWAVVAEAIQTFLRREGFSKPYEALKALTRTNEKITKSSVHEFISSLEIENNLKDELLKITPNNYTGIKLV
jgi:adenylosuccinate lyase